MNDYNGLKTKKYKRAPIMEPLIEIDNASVAKDGQNILENVSLKVFPGENIAVLGPNGAGKSSLLKLITKEYYPICAEGITPIKIYAKTSWDIFELRSRFGIVSPDLQAAHAKDISGSDIILSGFFGSVGLYEHQDITPDMKEKAASVAGFLGIGQLTGKYASKMSPGEARKFLIARALVNDPGVLILDEPTSGLDIKAAHDFLNLLRKIASSGKNIFLITHRINEIFPEISRVVLIKDGRIFRDGIKEEVLTSKNLSALYDMEIMVRESDGFYWITYK
jgi:iron complex transport system ATP-binding protein